MESYRVTDIDAKRLCDTLIDLNLVGVKGDWREIQTHTSLDLLTRVNEEQSDLGELRVDSTI